MLDSQCLIDMNARVYDPTLAQFQSADSIVSDPLYSQAYNRYAYVLGNPLAFTDPSGNATGGCVSVDGGPWNCTYYPVACENGCGGYGNGSGNGPEGLGSGEGRGVETVVVEHSRYKPPAPPSPQQVCVNTFNSTTVGEATNFFSLLSPVLGPNPWWQSAAEITGSYGLKAGTYYAGEAAGRAALNPELNPTTAGFLSGVNGLTRAGLSFAKQFGVPLVAGATILQAEVHLTCYLFSPQGGQ
jgi:RHS repeat-associated protein